MECWCCDIVMLRNKIHIQNDMEAPLLPTLACHAISNTMVIFPWTSNKFNKIHDQTDVEKVRSIWIFTE